MVRKALGAAALALTLAATVLGSTQASAGPFGPHFVHPGPFGHGPFGHGPFGGPGFGWAHGAGWGWGHGPGWGWGGPRPVVYGGCFLKRFVDDYGELVIRRVCY